ncbi:DUF3630 family protein [Photobacterium lipolyticum]|uniref:DUF3630 domain-containing protein n=1 Tax=Photobacterium lipolyticum TaxID=266810 RepID=A0A2T3MU01_9GAMM|nr:DUF3630 family protein [Photobacterium lipolyticum]PSW03405.1 DUF3630 domain-containing protein [Photobacterium lipolyticum]
MIALQSASGEFFFTRALDLVHSRLLLSGPEFDFDTFPEIAELLLTRIDACLIERELNADLHLWLIDFEGSRLMLKGEHYSGALWLEALSPADSDTLSFIASLLPQQPDLMG